MGLTVSKCKSYLILLLTLYSHSEYHAWVKFPVVTFRRWLFWSFTNRESCSFSTEKGLDDETTPRPRELRDKVCYFLVGGNRSSSVSWERIREELESTLGKATYTPGLAVPSLEFKPQESPSNGGVLRNLSGFARILSLDGPRQW